MSNILISTPPTSLATGLLQLDNGVAISSTPVYVADQTNTDSKLALSTTSVNINTLTGSALMNIKGIDNSNTNYSFSIKNLGGTDIFQTRNDGYTFIPNLNVTYNSTALNGTFTNGSFGNVQINSPSAGAKLGVKGSGSTSATTTLLVQNSSGSNSILTTDDGKSLLTATISNDAPLVVNNAYGWAGSYVARCQTWLSAGSEVARIMANGSMILQANITASTFKATQNIPSDVSFGGNGSGNGMYMPSANVTAFATSSTQRMLIDSTGLIGMNNSSPYKLLSLKTTTSVEALEVRGADNSAPTPYTGIRFSVADQSVVTDTYNKGAIYYINNTLSNAIGSFVFALNNTGSGANVSLTDEKMRLLNNGNLLIGTTTDAGYKLNVNGDAQINTLRVGLGAGSISSNTVLGNLALNSNVTGSANTAVGNQALRNSTSSNNTAVGNQSLYATTTGGSNTSMGAGALRNNTNGEFNTAIGDTCLNANISGTENVGVGASALANSTASRNVAIGMNAMLSNTTGERNVAVGYATNSGNFSNSVMLGYGATATGSNQMVFGSASGTVGTVVAGANVSSQYWNVKINGTDYKILLA